MYSLIFCTGICECIRYAHGHPRDQRGVPRTRTVWQECNVPRRQLPLVIYITDVLITVDTGENCTIQFPGDSSLLTASQGQLPRDRSSGTDPQGQILRDNSPLTASQGPDPRGQLPRDSSPLTAPLGPDPQGQIFRDSSPRDRSSGTDPQGQLSTDISPLTAPRH